jgi:hypothetical protein
MSINALSLLFLVAMLVVAFVAFKLARMVWKLIAWAVLIALGLAFWLAY